MQCIPRYEQDKQQRKLHAIMLNADLAQTQPTSHNNYSPPLKLHWRLNTSCCMTFVFSVLMNFPCRSEKGALARTFCPQITLFPTPKSASPVSQINSSLQLQFSNQEFLNLYTVWNALNSVLFDYLSITTSFPRLSLPSLQIIHNTHTTSLPSLPPHTTSSPHPFLPLPLLLANPPSPSPSLKF
jgi:hypothetical protein